jgi:hypothetical protein
MYSPFANGRRRGSTVEIVLSTDPWDEMDVDAFVCPVNSACDYKHFPSSRVRELSGLDLATILAPHTPLAVGAAFVSEAGRMRARNLIHVPNCNDAAEQIQVEDIARAAAAAIVACQVKNFTTVAIPLMGAFESGIPAEEAARAIHSEFRSHRGEKPAKVFLMARNGDEVEVFEMAVEGVG